MQELPTPPDDDAEDAARRREIAASPLGRHELLHTAWIVTDLFGRQVSEHPAVEFGDDELKAAADRAFDALFDFYQLCGRQFGSDENRT